MLLGKTQDAGGRETGQGYGEGAGVPAGLGARGMGVEDLRGDLSSAQVRDWQFYLVGASAAPDGQVADLRRAQAERDPRVVPVRQAERPEGHRLRDRGPDVAVDPDRGRDQVTLAGAHLVEVAGEVNPAQHRAGHREDRKSTRLNSS